jgi:hypothetical protein
VRGVVLQLQGECGDCPEERAARLVMRWVGGA